MENIKSSAEKLVLDIRNYSRAQKEYWQRVPLLALKAYGKYGFRDCYVTAYQNGFWPLETGSRDGMNSIVVDLASGELVDAFSASFPKQGYERASESDVINLAFNLYELDAKDLVSSLEKEVSMPHKSNAELQEQEAWKERTRLELGLEKIYTRSS